ncbi:MAG: urease accessory protein UreF [Roseovarius sp.]|nr:urease accessory protein UreF [Roseovarius sp.]MBK45641.1 urease accessory protein UreF [Roseovarius sp.]|tara:strand:- start:196 stop:840 length:645 start_codon:yes stop_codon:yes gene_type:complete
MPTDSALLILTQWLSPAYPTGAFAWSHGVEAAVAAGWVRDAPTLEGWLADILTDGSGRSDAVYIALAHAAPGDELGALDHTARAYAPSAERLREAAQQGAAFARVTREIWSLDLPDLLLPLALGRAARLLNLPLRPVIALYLQAFASNLVAAAQRLMPLGQTEAQHVLARLAPLCARLAEEGGHATEADLFSNCFLSDIAAMRHETQQPRIFQS